MEYQPEIEICLKVCLLDRAIDWVRSHIVHLSGPEEAGDAIAFYPVTGSIVITPRMESDFLGIWFNTSLRPWATDAECARAAARELGCVAVCDPGSEYPEIPPQSNVFLEVNGSSERLIELV